MSARAFLCILDTRCFFIENKNFFDIYPKITGDFKSERVQEIGILLSIGTEKGEIRRMFLYEAFILGITGAIIGGIMSVIIGYSVVSAMIGNTSYFFLPESMVYIPGGMFIGMIVCIVSGLYPSWRVSNMELIDALRNE